MKMRNKFLKFIFRIAGIFLLTSGSNMWAIENGIDPVVYEINFIILIAVLVIVFFAFIYYGMDKTIERPARISKYFVRIKDYIIGLAPMEKEKDILLEHDFDGIKELDNKIPPWFNYLFYGTILFGIYYMIDYHVLKSSQLPVQEYQEEIRQAEIRRAALVKSGALVNENTVTLLDEPEALSSGENIYNLNCVPCHGGNGQGIIGPNLTDQYWIHGGGIKDIFQTIKYGVPAKGMVSWEGQLNPRQIQEVSSYVFSLVGTNPPNPKEPEGEKWVENDSLGTGSDNL